MTHPLRESGDFYPTPPEATHALLSVERFDGPIWEPACGNGAISKVLFKGGHVVVSTDLFDRGYGQPDINFLREQKARAKHIITNPPYGRGLADLFIHHALRLTKPTEGSVAMLLDIASLAHPIRYAFYVNNPPANVYLIDELICQPAGQPRLRRADMRFAWLVWKPFHKGRPTLWWLSMASFKDRTQGARP